MKSSFVFISILLFSFLLLIAGCGGNKQPTDDFITVDVMKSYSKKKDLILQDLMDVEYIALETTDDFVNQGNVQAIGKEVILVKNYRNDGDVFVYDRKGKVVRKINRKGQGGEEYTFCRSITLDEDNNEIFIDDHYARKILVYDLEGNFKRSFKQKEGGGTQYYWEIFNYDKENLICYDECNEEIPFLLVSKLDGSITREIRIPFKEKKIFIQILRTETGTRAAGPDDYCRITPFNGNLILVEPPSDTIYTLMPDCSLRPFITRTPPIHSMNPEVFIALRLISNRYYFMECLTNQYDFSEEEGFPKTYLMYDTKGKEFFRYAIYNGDYSYKKEVYMVSLTPINRESELWCSIDASSLRDDYEKGKLKGKLKEIAATLAEDSNSVIMLVKHKK